jgi:hypothetical protein
MLVYGLFLARLNSGANTVDLGNARDYVPGSFKLIREHFLHYEYLIAPYYYTTSGRRR